MSAMDKLPQLRRQEELANLNSLFKVLDNHLKKKKKKVKKLNHYCYYYYYYYHCHKF